jgi:hypothetical protein
MEVIDIGLGDLETININLNDDSSSNSVRFPVENDALSSGGGIEFLMNDKHRSANNTVNLDLGDIDDLEKDLNNLSSGSGSSSSSSGGKKSESGFSGMVQNLFGFGNSDKKEESTTSSSMYEKTDSKLGQSTASQSGAFTKTWDGFTKSNNIPVRESSSSGSNNSSASYRSSNSLSDKEKRRKKRDMLQKMEEWNDSKQFKHMANTNLTMDSSFEDIEDEYENAIDQKRRKESIKMQGWWLMAFVNTLEYANSALNPFDINLDGFSEKVSEEVGTYDEIFGELHEKYRGGKLSPEVALLLKLGVSAAAVSISNKALSSAAPGFNDVIKQSPELMRMFTDATVKSMSSQSPGFSFASNMMNGGPPENINTSFGPPPKPVETKNQAPIPRPGTQYESQGMAQPQGINMNSRPDLAFSRGSMFQQPPQQRPEMRGPQHSDIESLLSGLKPKAPMADESEYGGNESMISVSSLHDLAGSGMPKRSNKRGRTRSDKNIISLDI